MSPYQNKTTPCTRIFFCVPLGRRVLDLGTAESYWTYAAKQRLSKTGWQSPPSRPLVLVKRR